MLRPALAAIILCAGTSAVRADEVARPIVGFRVKGHTKITERTLGYIAHVELGDLLKPSDVVHLQVALMSSELFTTATVELIDTPEGLIVEATLDDKLSWFAAPTVYVLPTNRAVGVGFVENDLGGRDQKMLLYGQLGTQTSLLFGTFLDPAVRGSKLTYRIDLYLEHRHLDEYENPPGDPRSFAISRSTTQNFLDGGLLVGWNFAWWLVADLRLRGAYVYFRDPHDASGAPTVTPEKDGWDVTTQARLTLDHRTHKFGVTWGEYVQAELEQSIPGLDSYGYGTALLRAYDSWRLFCEHELEIRGIANAGYHIPFHEELALGGVSDLRGYPTDQFRGDVTFLMRAEYSVPIVHFTLPFFRFRIPLALRGLGFYDGGYSGFHFRRPSDRDYLPSQLGPGVFRNDVGAGFRVYVKSVVLPLLGFDVGYGIEGHSPEVYFEVGLTDF